MPYLLDERKKGIVSLIILSIIYSLVALIPRYLNSSFLIFQQLYLRTMIGFIFALFLFRKHVNFQKIIKTPLKNLSVILLRAILYYLFGVTLWMEALIITKISNVAFIGAIPMTAILGFTILKEKITFQKIGLVLLSFLGVLIISVKDYSNIFSIDRGEILIIAATFFLALGKIARRWESDRLNDKETTLVLLFFTTIILLTISLLKGDGLPLTNWNLGVSLVLILGGLLNIGIAYYVSYGFARVDAVFANNIIQLNIPFTILMAYIFYQELPIVREVIGGIIIITSVYLLEYVERKNKSYLEVK